MAEFNPQIPGSDVPNFTGVSQGTGRDDSFATLFGGITDAIAAGVKIKDESTQNKIREEASAGFDQTNKDFGFDPPAAPSGMASDLDRMKSLQAAVEQGKISQVNYYGRLATLTKQLRTKYPGYEEIVDQTIQSVTGTRPANAFRDAIFGELESLAQDASDEVKFQRQWTKENEGVLAAIYGEDYFRNPESYDQKEVRARVAGFKGRSELIQAESQSLALAASQGQMNDRRAAKAVDQDFSFIVESSMNKALSLNGPSAMSKINEFIERGSPSGEDLNAFISQITTLENEVRTQLATRGRQAYVSSGVMNQETVNKAIESALYPITKAKEAVLGGDFKLAAKYSTLNKAITDNQLNTMLAADPAFRAGMGLNEINQTLGENFLNQRLDQLGTVALEVAGRAMAGQPDIIRSVVENGDGKLSKTVMTESFKAIVDPKLSGDQFSNVIDQFFGPSAIDFMSPKTVAAEDLERIYLQFLRPEVTNAVFSKGTDEDKAKYVQWALEKAQAIPSFRAAAGEVNTLIRLDGAELKVDPKSMKVGLVLGPNQSTPVVYQRTISAFNRTVDVLKPIFEAQGLDPEQAIVAFAKDMNIKIDGGREGGLFELIADSYVEEESEEVNPLGVGGGKAETFTLPDMSIEGSSVIDFIDKETGELVTDSKRGSAPDIGNLRPELAAGVQSLQASWGRPLPIVSGYRDAKRNAKAGGAKHSQHMHGNAVDIDVSQLSKAERVELIRLARSQGFGGIGVYANSLHLDKGSKRAWGPSYKSASLPTWAQAAFE